MTQPEPLPDDLESTLERREQHDRRRDSDKSLNAKAQQAGIKRRQERRGNQERRAKKDL